MVGEKIRELRKQKGWSQEELAKLTGYKDKSAINKIESGINQLTQTKIKKFADVFGCEVSDFFMVSPVTPEDLSLLARFHEADEETQKMVYRILDYKKEL